MREKARELAELILAESPESREQSLALTHLEETVMWTNAAIARNERERQVVESSDVGTVESALGPSK